MQFMNRENVLNLRSFWQIQIVGWCGFYLFNLLESVHNFLTQRVSIVEQTVPIFFMFLEVARCVLFAAGFCDSRSHGSLLN